MKNHIAIIVSLCFCCFFHPVFASQYVSFFAEIVERMEIHKEGTIAQQIEEDLLAKVWYQEDRKFLFNASGLVSIVKISNNEVQNRNWKVEANNEVAYLKMANADSSETIYRLEKEGTSLRWIDQRTNLPVKTDSTPLRSLTKMVKAKKSLIGNWSSSVYPSTVIKDLEGENGRNLISADFKYMLRADGSFSKVTYLNRKKHSAVNGLWQVSEDGKHLILHFQQKNQTYTTQVAEIKLLAMDELVLGQALATSNLEEQLCSQKKTFFYNKQ